MKEYCDFPRGGRGEANGRRASQGDLVHYGNRINRFVRVSDSETATSSTHKRISTNEGAVHGAA